MALNAEGDRYQTVPSCRCLLRYREPCSHAATSAPAQKGLVRYSASVAGLVTASRSKDQVWLVQPKANNARMSQYAENMAAYKPDITATVISAPVSVTRPKIER
jgi:hypothetical protein